MHFHWRVLHFCIPFRQLKNPQFPLFYQNTNKFFSLFSGKTAKMFPTDFDRGTNRLRGLLVIVCWIDWKVLKILLNHFEIKNEFSFSVCRIREKKTKIKIFQKSFGWKYCTYLTDHFFTCLWVLWLWVLVFFLVMHEKMIGFLMIWSFLF